MAVHKEHSVWSCGRLGRGFHGLMSMSCPGAWAQGPGVGRFNDDPQGSWGAGKGPAARWGVSGVLAVAGRLVDQAGESRAVFGPELGDRLRDGFIRGQPQIT